MQVQIHPSAIGWEGLYPLGRKASNKVRALPLIESILHVRVNATLHCRHSMDATKAEVNTSVSEESLCLTIREMIIRQFGDNISTVWLVLHYDSATIPH